MKINRTRSITSLQPNDRNGHKPSIVTGFWGDKSVGVRGTSCGPGRIPITEEAIKLAWYENLHPVDEKTLKEVKPKMSLPVKKEKPKADLFDLVAAFNKRRSR